MKTKKVFNYEKQNPVPNFEGGVINEPLILFGGSHIHVDPKVGLGLYGPYTTIEQKTPSLKSIPIGIIGPSQIVSDAQQWLDACKGALLNDGTQPFLYPHFSGFNENVPFQCELISSETWNESFSSSELSNALKIDDFFCRIDSIVKLYVEKLEVLSQRDPKPSVVLCCIPQEVIDLCTVRILKNGEVKRIKYSEREKKLERRRLKLLATGQLDIFNQMHDLLNDEDPFVHQNLRRGIKAEAMKYGIPTQLVWPRTLALATTSKSNVKERSSQDIATRAWNFSTALYYKSGGTPWRLSKIEQGVCFVGISFYRDLKAKDSRMRTCMAQTFTAAGDGYVLRGNTFEWDESLGKSPHLDQNSAHSLIQRVLDLYRSQNRGQLPGRIVVHKTSKFWEEELAGFESACEIIPRKDFVAFGRRGVQFYRPGEYPPLRGTYIKFSNDNFLLYTAGYTPFLKSYNGPRVPMPLEIIQFIGDSPWMTMLSEILALTKMNWNTADFSCSKPITVAFSQKVGQILAELPEDYPVRSEYRYYM